MVTTSNALVRLLAGQPPITVISECSLGVRDLLTRGYMDDRQTVDGQTDSESAIVYV